jgi:ABC-type Fe3+/spermidine/putrescine transport system ATPase subunit
VAVNGDGNGPASLALRPHRLRLTAAGRGRIDGTCRRVDYLGSHHEVLVDTAWGSLLLFAPDDASPPAAGSAVGVDFDPAAAIVIRRAPP